MTAAETPAMATKTQTTSQRPIRSPNNGRAADEDDGRLHGSDDRAIDDARELDGTEEHGHVTSQEHAAEP